MQKVKPGLLIHLVRRGTSRPPAHTLWQYRSQPGVRCHARVGFLLTYTFHRVQASDAVRPADMPLQSVEKPAGCTTLLPGQNKTLMALSRPTKCPDRVLELHVVELPLHGLRCATRVKHTRPARYSSAVVQPPKRLVLPWPFDHL